MSGSRQASASHAGVPHLERLPRSVELLREAGVVQWAFVDQTLLPGELRFVRTGDWHAVVRAITSLQVRGAPAIGVAGAAAIALWAAEAASAKGPLPAAATPLADTMLPAAAAQVAATGSEGVSAGVSTAGERDAYLAALDAVANSVAQARPTAVNLSWGVARAASEARELAAGGASAQAVADGLFDLVKRMEAEDEAVNRAIGAHGAALLASGSRVLTHCNAGSLATVFYGTALGVVYAAAAQGKVARVYASETRPVGQGARLTSWELSRAGVPVTLICDDMVASLMAQGMVDAVIVGADRVAANGDVANKIGTYGVAVLARHHGIPFYVAAPTSTIDASLATGASIPIEQRVATEVLPQPIEGVQVWNPAFDVTPAALVTGIITEKGVLDPCDVAITCR